MVEHLIPDNVPSSMSSPPKSESLSDPDIFLAGSAIQGDIGALGCSCSCVNDLPSSDTSLSSETRGFCVKGGLRTE